MTRHKFQAFHVFLLAGIIALAVVFRTIGIRWDGGAHLHPDERFLTMVATNITWPKNIIEYFDTRRSPMNPHNKDFSFYVYGTYPTHLTKAAALAIGKQTYDETPIVGRIISVVLDTATVIVVFLIAIHLSRSIWAGLIAAFCYSIYVLPIQLSHFFTVDPYVTLFATLAVYRALRGKTDFLTGIFAGLAVSAKISAVLIIPIIVLSLIITHINKKDGSKNNNFILFFWRLGTFILGLMATVRIAYPYLFDGWALNKKVLDNWEQLASFNDPSTSFPPGIQWINASGFQVPSDLVIWGLGIPLGIIGVASFGYYLYRAVTQKHARILFVPVAYILLFIVHQSFQFSKPMRYLWPIYPMIAVLSGMLLTRLFSHIVIHFHARLKLATTVIWAICMILLAWPVSFLSVYTNQNSRVAANTWIYTHIKQQSVIAWEHWDDPMPFPMNELSPSNYQQIQLPSFDPDDHEKPGKISTVLAKSDYLILSSNRAYGAINRADKRFPFMNNFYRKLFSGKLGYTVAAQFVSRPTLPFPAPLCIRIPGFYYGYLSRTVESCEHRGIQIIDDYADETFTVYDHPKVIIFRNIRHHSAQDLTRLMYERN